MQVLILDENARRLDRSMVGFFEAGLDVSGSGSAVFTDLSLRRAGPDLLILSVAAAREHGLDLIRMAEAQNPGLTTILLASDVAESGARFAAKVRSVHCILGSDISAEMILRLGLSCVSGAIAARSRAIVPAVARASVVPAQSAA